MKFFLLVIVLCMTSCSKTPPKKDLSFSIQDVPDLISIDQVDQIVTGLRRYGPREAAFILISGRTTLSDELNKMPSMDRATIISSSSLLAANSEGVTFLDEIFKNLGEKIIFVKGKSGVVEIFASAKGDKVFMVKYFGG
jgi:hypothetical protein